MRRAPLLALLGTSLTLTLGSCARTTDNFTPRISVTDTGATRSANGFLVQGYVLDDTGVTDIQVDGKSVPIQPGSRKIARFQFQAVLSTPTGQYTITARDAAGNEAKFVLPVSVDPVRPTVKVTRFERSGNVIRVAGVATDNVRVAQVSVDGNRLNITPGPLVEFYAETTGVYADLQVRDNAGNITKKRAQ